MGPPLSTVYIHYIYTCMYTYMYKHNCFYPYNNHPRISDKFQQQPHCASIMIWF